MRGSTVSSSFARSVFIFAVTATLLNGPAALASTDSRFFTIQSIDENGRYQGDIKFTIDGDNNTTIELCPSKEVMPSSSGCHNAGSFNKFDLRDLLVKVNNTAKLKRNIKTGLNLVLVSLAVASGVVFPELAALAAIVGSVPAITCVHVNGDLRASERCTNVILQGLAELETLRPGKGVTIKAQADLPEFIRTLKKVIPNLR
jgi:hypothetical protein